MRDKPMASRPQPLGAQAIDANPDIDPNVGSYSPNVEHEAEKVSREPTADNLDALVRAILNDASRLTGKLDAEIRRVRKKEAA